MTSSDAAPSARIAARKICKSFSAPVLRNVDLAIPVGSIHGLVGENGAGKSTLARIMVGLEQAGAGSLLLDGQPYRPGSTAESLRAGVAICTQELSLVDDLSIAENILLQFSHRAFARIRRKQAEATAANLLDVVGLSQASPDTRVGKLSLAEKQLVEIAKALSTGPKLLILDEPTSALTEPQSARLHAILREQTRDDVTVIYISHRLGDVLAVCDRVSVLRDGKVRLTRNSNALSEKTLIREMAGADRDFHASPRSNASAAPVRLSVADLRTGELPHPISFECRSGEILGIAGLAGSGRTELLNAILGLHKRLSGRVKIHVDGIAVEAKNARQAVKCGAALVAEDRSRDGVFRDQAVAFNVTIAGLARIANRFGALLRSRETRTVGKLIEALEVRSRGVGQSIRELSGGNQQKLMLARWLHCQSQLLLLDEPTRGVDVAAKLSIHEELVRLRDGGMSVVVVSSELDELGRLCDRTLVLSNRKLVAEFDRDNWCHEGILAAAFSEYVGAQPPSSAAVP